MNSTNLIPVAAGSVTELALPSALTAPPNPLSLLKALRWRWRLAVFVGTLTSVLVAVACWYFMPPSKLTARTLMRLPPGSPFLFRTAEPIPNLENHQRNQIAMVKSRLVLNAALKDSRVANLTMLRDISDPIQWLERELQADFNVAPEVFRISLAGDDADAVVALVNSVRDAYTREILEKERADRNERARTLEEKRVKNESELRTRRDDQRRFEQLAGGRDPTARGIGQALREQQLYTLQRELIQVQSELRRSRADLVALTEAEKNGSAAPVSEALVDDQLTKEPAIQSARARIQQSKVVYEETVKAANNGDANPKAIELRKKIDDEEQTLATLREKLKPGVVEDLRQRARSDTARNKVQTEARIAFALETEKAVTAEMERLQNAIKEKADNFIKADVVREDMTSLEAMTKRITDEENAVKFEIGVPARYSVLEEAVPIQPVDSKRTIIATCGAGLGTFVAVLLGFALVEFRARRVDTPDEVFFGLGLPVVGSIPDTETKEARALKSEGGPTYVNEAVDTLRTMLLRSDQHDALRVVMVTSAQSGEGKTSLSTQLAVSLAQIGHNTLFIDGDLRNPIAHRVFDLRRGPGLCEVLRGEKTLDEVIRPTPVSNLSMITAGRWDGESTRALAQDGAHQLIESVRERFDFIIIDTSPVLPVVDPLLLGQHADCVILSVLREVSRMPRIYAAYQRLTEGGVRVLGAVMNGVRIDRYGVRYPYATYAADMDQPSEQDETVGAVS
jgi:capsular exopolysaccharide synthesis family protein